MPKVLNRRTDDCSKAVYVGRPSKWGNPYTIGSDGSRPAVVRKYRKYLADSNPLRELLHELRGKDLACWCAPLACHADVLLELANLEGKG